MELKFKHHHHPPSIFFFLTIIEVPHSSLQAGFLQVTCSYVLAMTAGLAPDCKAKHILISGSSLTWDQLNGCYWESKRGFVRRNYFHHCVLWCSLHQLIMTCNFRPNECRSEFNIRLFLSLITSMYFVDYLVLPLGA